MAGRWLRPSPVFDTYWRFAFARQNLYLSRIRDCSKPWSTDPVLQKFRFTNVYRATDRVTQYLISKVQYRDGAPQSADEIVFRTLLFKTFNRISTWEQLEGELGEITWANFRFDHYEAALRKASSLGPIYSAAYMMPPPKFGEAKKYRNHLRLLELMMADGLPGVISKAKSLQQVFADLVRYQSIGPFLAYQYAIDLNYSPVLELDENEFVVAGPGAKDGIRKCFGKDSAGIESEIIEYMVTHQENHFQRLSLDFESLNGRPIHLIDAQNVFCEVDKYSRVAHPEISGISGRSRIKQRFEPSGQVDVPVFPPKWNLASGNDWI